jgi:hypothetical protein
MIGDIIIELIRKLLTEMIIQNYENIFTLLNSVVVAAPDWFGIVPAGSMFDTIKAVSDVAILPIAGLIITFVAMYELIQMVIDKNNLRDFETFIFMKWIIKTGAGVYVISHCFDIIKGFFVLVNTAIAATGSYVGEIDIPNAIDDLRDNLDALETGELFKVMFESTIFSLVMTVLGIAMIVMVFGRVIEMYISMSIAPIPASTVINRELGHTGTNYFKSLFALALQGFLMMVVIVLMNTIISDMRLMSIETNNVAGNSMLMNIAFSVTILFTMFKTGRIASSLIGAH